MPEVNINGIQINFPFEPYQLQQDYMKKVLDCLQNGENGVLESPTGTGKTLSLLCSSLAWLIVRKAQIQANAQGLMTFETSDDFVSTIRGKLDKIGGKDTQGSWSNVICSPKIIYASRTHSQLAQVIAELKRTSYSHMKVAVLGSRDQMCVHPDVIKEETSSGKILGCQIRVEKRSCHFYNNVETKKSDPVFSEGIMDIEDIFKQGKNNQCCPYYLARELQKSADIIFMPYNYLLDAKTRFTLDIDFRNNVIILDEGHNVEKICEESASVQLSSTDIALCITSVTQAMRSLCDQLSDATDGTPEQIKDFTLDDLCILKTLFMELENTVYGIQLDSVSGQKVGKAFKGSYVFELLAKAEIRDDNWTMIKELLFKVAQHQKSTNETTMGSKGGILQTFSDFLTIVYSSKNMSSAGLELTDSCYKVYVEPEVKKASGFSGWSTTKTATNPNAKVVSFWCFSPAFTMKALLDLGVHSIIITSGTLSPLQATISELGIPINVQLENQHIIKSNQICVTVVKKGPGNEELKSSYENRERPEYLRDLGQTLLNFCRKIPDGFLVFFPSYHALTVTVNFWQHSGQWSKIIEVKPVYVEPREKQNLSNIMSEYYTAIKEGHSRGAILLAVLRGKVSEGLDFTDARGRAVMITGLPYPPYKDPRVVLKREYIDQSRAKKQTTLTGSQWYELEATKAVNQAVGRVIRHANDYGTIILCDSRFDRPYTINTLSAWLRPHVCACNSFGQAFGKVTAFFRNIGDIITIAGSSQGASFEYAKDVKSRVLQAKATDVEDENKERRNNFNAFLEQMKSETLPAKNNLADEGHGLLDALNNSQQIKSIYNPLTAVAPEQTIEHKLEPALKKRKLKLVPLKFDDTTEELTSTDDKDTSTSADEYLIKVKRSLDEKKFLIFRNAVKHYKINGDYAEIVKTLTQLFPGREMHHLMIGFIRFIKGKDKPRFDTLCKTMYKT